jgi:hypothetical protein
MNKAVRIKSQGLEKDKITTAREVQQLSFVIKHVINL